MVNIVKNPSFEVDTNGDGVPDDWQATVWFGGGMAVNAY